MSQNHKKQLIYLITLISSISCQFVWTQMPGVLVFDKNTPQRSLPLKFTPNSISSQKNQKYSIWGWFKSEGQNPAISNIITLKQTNGDLLYINYDLNPVPVDSTKNQTFSLIFLIQKGIVENRSEMAIEGFTDLLRTDSWSFFGISADYENGSFTIFLKVFDGVNIPLTKNFDFDFVNFNLDQNADLIVGGVEGNSYFDSVSGFIGQIANIEMGLFFTNNLSFMWTGYMLENSRAYDGVILEFLFDFYNENEGLISHGAINEDFAVNGLYTPLYKIDPNRLGGRFNEVSSIDLGNVSFRNSESNIKTMAYLFHFLYEDNLPDYFTLLTRGQKGTDGFLEIWLEKTNNGRVLKMALIGENNKELFWESNTIFDKNTIYYFIVGMSQSIGNSARVLYIDNLGGNDFSLLSDDFNFNFSPQNINLFQKPENVVQTIRNENYNGYIDLYRFMILNSGSSLVQFLNYNTSTDIKNSLDNSNNLQDKLCVLRASFYEKSGCFLCGNSIVFSDPNDSNLRECLNYCPFGFKNAATDVCIQCALKNCGEIESTEWDLQKVTNDKWIITPSRPILTPNIDYKNLFDISLEGEENSQNAFTYSTTPNYDKQEVEVDFDFKENIKNENLVLKSYQDAENPIFDVNRNLLYKTSSNFTIDRVCYVSDKKRKSLNSLAYVILLLFVISFVFMILASIICYNKIFDLLGLWKFLLHHWMKLQLVAFFAILGIYMPCCLREFLHSLYKFAISWDHHLRNWINDINENSSDYREGINEPISRNFDYENVKAFILHNMGIFFIVHLVIFIIYLLIKIWDCLSNSVKKNFMFKLIVFIEFFFLIVGFLLVHMQIFVFSSLNWKNADFSHSYFIFCFILSICYILVFLSFWIFAASVLFPDSNYLDKPSNYNKFYFFFAGFRKTRAARTYDLILVLIHFIIGLMLGLLYNRPLIQIIVILSLLVILLLITIGIRPWSNCLLNVIDIISQLLIIGAVIIFLIYQLWDKAGCEECGDREGKLCWLIVFFLFFALLLPLIFLMIQSMIEACRKRVYRNVTEVNRYYKTENSDYGIEDNRLYEERYVENNNFEKDIDYDNQNFENEIVNKNVNIVNKEVITNNIVSQNISTNGISKNYRNNMTMDEVIENGKMEMNGNFGEFGNGRFARNEGFTDMGDSISQPDIIKPDVADEEDFQPSLIEALNLNKKDTSEIKSELDLTKLQIERKKNQFYSNFGNFGDQTDVKNYQIGEKFDNNDYLKKNEFGKNFGGDHHNKNVTYVETTKVVKNQIFENNGFGKNSEFDEFRNTGGFNKNEFEGDDNIFGEKKILNENVFDGEKPIQTISKKYITHEVIRKGNEKLEDF